MLPRCRFFVFKSLSLPYQDPKKSRRTLEASLLPRRRKPVAAPTHRGRTKIDPTFSHDGQWHGAEVVQPERDGQQPRLREPTVFHGVGETLQPVEPAQG